MDKVKKQKPTRSTQTMIFEVEDMIDHHCTSMTSQGTQCGVFPDGDSPIQLVNPPNKTQLR